MFNVEIFEMVEAFHLNETLSKHFIIADKEMHQLQASVTDHWVTSADGVAGVSDDGEDGEDNVELFSSHTERSVSSLPVSTDHLSKLT